MTAPKSIQDSYEEVVPGVYAGVPNEVYHAANGFSHSDIVKAHKSISTYLWYKQNQKQTDAMLQGSALHDLVLLPDTYKNTYSVCSTKGKNTKAYKDMAKDESRIVLTSAMESNIHYMRDALYSNPTIRDILESKTTLREVSMWVRDYKTGLVRKIRPDMISNGVIYDVKTSVSPTPKGFLHSIFEYKYHLQSAYYQDTSRLNDLQITDFVFLVVGSLPPYLTAIYNINPDLLEEGRMMYQETLSRLATYYLGEDEWDGLTSGREVVTL